MAGSDNISDFRRGIDAIADNLPNAVNEVIKLMCRSITFTVVDATPVDTAEARSNWLVSLSVPIRGTIEPYSPYPKFSQALGQGRGETANAAAAKARAVAIINARRPGQTVVIQNNTDHIEELNRGSSKQAPAMFVEDGVRAGIRALNGAELKLC